MMQHNVGYVRDEMSGVGLGLGGHRDGFRTEGGTSHNPATLQHQPSLASCPSSLSPTTLTKPIILAGRRHFKSGSGHSIMERQLTLTSIALCQDQTLIHYL